jgi:hypothetical protein
MSSEVMDTNDKKVNRNTKRFFRKTVLYFKVLKTEQMFDKRVVWKKQSIERKGSRFLEKFAVCDAKLPEDII